MEARCLGDYESMGFHADFLLKTLQEGTSAYNTILYLKLESLRLLGRYSDARNFIDGIGFLDNSFEYLKAVRKSVDSISSMNWFKEKMDNFVSVFGGIEHKFFNYAVLFNELGLKDKAVLQLKNRLELVIEKNVLNEVSSNAESNINNWSALAGQALLDLHLLFSSKEIEFFLVSGTLLGVVRDNKILDHDYDIDIGVDESYSFNDIVSAFSCTGLFYMLENKFNNLFVSFMHVNGVKVDVFVHYDLEGKYRHRTRYVAWDNSKFTLTKKFFLGEYFLIPDNPNNYLTENYGDWSLPVESYNTYLDTPNLVCLCNDDIAFQLLLLITSSVINKNKSMYDRASKRYFDLTQDDSYVSKLLFSRE